MIAMMVILIGISGVTGVLWWGTQHQAGGATMVEATNHARIITETIMGQGLIAGTNWPTAGSGLVDGPNDRSPLYDLNINPGATHLSPTALSRFQRNVNCQRLSDLNGTSGTEEDRLALISVTVYWTEKGEGYGSHERNVTLRTVAPHAVGN